MVISINTGKASDKTEHPFMVKKKKETQKTGNRWNFLNMAKGIYEKPGADIIFSGEK